MTFTWNPAGRHADIDSAYVECLAALDDLPPHLDVDEVRIWRFSDGDHMDAATRGKWTWRVSFSGNEGGYDEPRGTREQRVAHRRRLAVAALRDAEAKVARP